MVEVIFLLFLRNFGGSIALDDVQPDVDKFPAYECPMCLQCQHQGHTLSMGVGKAGRGVRGDAEGEGGGGLNVSCVQWLFSR